MSQAVSHISSAIFYRETHLASLDFQDRIQIPQRVFHLSADSISELKSDAVSKLNTPDNESIDFASILPVDFSHLGIFEDLKKYFEGVAEDLKKNADLIIADIEKIDWSEPKSVKEGFKLLGEYLMPVFEYVKDHPWILLPLLIPMFDLFLWIVGFRLAGVNAGSLASKLHSHIGNVEKGSLFAFFQSAGARGWAFDALYKANNMITIAVIIVAVGQYLIESGIIDPEKIQEALEGAWNRAVQKFNPPPVEMAAIANGQVTVLNLNHGWMKYGVWASLLIPVMVCAGEGL